MSMLRSALLANASFSTLTGAIALLGPGWVGDLLGAPAPEVYTIVGAQLLVFAALVGWVARPRRPNGLAVAIISAADLLWVVGTAALLTGWGAMFSATGTTVLIAVAIAVDTFAVFQLWGLARQRRSAAASDPALAPA